MWVTLYVASFRGLGARWDVDVKAPCEVAHASDVGAVRSLRGQNAEVALSDEPGEVSEGVGQEYDLPAVRMADLLFRVIVSRTIRSLRLRVRHSGLHTGPLRCFRPNPRNVRLLELSQLLPKRDLLLCIIEELDETQIISFVIE